MMTKLKKVKQKILSMIIRGMSQLFDSYKSQSGSFQNMMNQQDSHSSHSKHFDFNARCQDQNVVNVDPHLSKICH